MLNNLSYPRTLNRIILLTGLTTFSAISFAVCSQTNNELGMVGHGYGGVAYAKVANSSTNECGCSEFRFQPSATDAKQALAVLLAGKMAGIKVRVDVDAAGSCDTATRVYLQ